MKPADSKLYLTVITVFLLLNTLSGCATQAGMGRRDEGLIGKVVVSGPNVSINNRPARSGMKVYSGDNVTTGSGSSAIVLFDKGGFFQLDENTDPLFILERLQEGFCILIKMLTGQSYTTSEGTCERVQTPDAPLALNSSANILIRPRRTEVTVIEGKVTLGLERPVSIAYPERAVVSRGQLGQVRKLSREEILDTISWRKKFDFPELHPEPVPVQPEWEVPIIPRPKRQRPQQGMYQE